MFRASITFCLTLCALAQKTPIIQTTTGPVRGFVHDGLDEYRGIPYAKPPVGNLRFQDPVPIDPWKDTFEAIHLNSSCPQFDITKGIFLGNEDCLHLDVYVPHKPVSKPLPVYFWIYGGGWVLGSKWEFGLYDPHKLMDDNDFIFVAPNYRLGPLGFLALNGTSGNMGLLDQNLALKWTIENIANFGGDPKRITIGGESAGGFSTCWHLGSPTNAGQFSGAIMESGSCDAPEFFRPWEKAVSFSQAFSKALKCDGTDDQIIACLRKMNVGPLISSYPDLHKYHATNYVPALYPAMPWAATYGGNAANILPDYPIRAMEKGKYNAVPLLTGTNANETNLFDFFLPQTVTKAYEDLLMDFFNHNRTFVNEIKAFYGWTNDTKRQRDDFTHLMTDYVFTCSTRRAVRLVSQKQDVHAYLFDYRSGLAEKIVGDAHATELVYVFGKPFVLLEFTEKDRQISAMFHHYWTNMIKTHDPNNAKENPQPTYVNWVPYKKDSEYLNIQDPKTTDIGLDYHSKECDFWDAYASTY